VSWDFSSTDSSNEKNYHHQLKLKSVKKFSISEKALEVLNDYKTTTLEKNPDSFKDVDTTWINTLQKFDFWNIDKNSPLDMYQRYTIASPIQKIELIFPRIHLIKAKVKNNDEFIDAIKDVLHFGELCLTTETLVGEMVFVATIGLATEAIKLRPHLSWLSFLYEGGNFSII